MLTATLGQEATQTILGALGSKIAAFKRDYALWQAQGRQEVAGLPARLAQIKARLGEGQRRLYAAGDVEGFRALGAQITQVEALERQAAEIANYAGRWGGAWETLMGWLGSVGSLVGLGFLPVIPLALSIPVALAAIAALAWVIAAWQETRARTQALADLADRVASGNLTAAEAAALARAAAPAPAGWFAGLGGLGGMVGVGVALLVALVVLGRR